MVVDLRLNKPISLEMLKQMTFEAGKFESNIHLIKENYRADVKSILGLASLALHAQDTVQLDVQGKDEKAALEKIECLLH